MVDPDNFSRLDPEAVLRKADLDRHAPEWDGASHHFGHYQEAEVPAGLVSPQPGQGRPRKAAAEQQPDEMADLMPADAKTDAAKLTKRDRGNPGRGL